MKGPFWVVPMEMVRGLATAAGTAQLVRLATMRDARFQPHAILQLRERRFVAVVTFETPGRPGHAETLAIGISAPALENAA